MKVIRLLAIITALLLAKTASAEIISTPKSIQAHGLANFYQLTDKIYSGSSPDGEVAFAELQKRGIKTIISVDGTKPDVKTAKKFGLRYVHLPFGYDGVPTNRAVELVKAAETVASPIYVHCHHGLHRGPAGAAVICEGTANWTPEQGLNWLKLAGTSANYAGLYKSVANFRTPSPDQLRKAPNNFPEISKISPLADVMVEVDGRFDNLKLIKKSDYQRLPSQPDLVPANEALLLTELFKEISRSPEALKRSTDFRVKLTEAVNATDALYQELHSTNQAQANRKLTLDTAFERTMNACNACHKKYRN